MPTKDSKHPDLASRINYILETMEWSKTKLAKECECGPGTVGNWLHRNSKMDAKYAFALQDKHRWNARWILEGVGPARMNEGEAKAHALVQKILELPDERRDAIAVLVESR
jgi:hypothetical protein